MATVQKFEDLICWQRARELTKFVYDVSRHRSFDADRGLQDQIRRAAVSVTSNIAEGFDRGTKFELVNYFYIAKGSCGEVKSQLYVAFDAGYIDISTLRNGLRLCDECSRLLQSFIFKVKSGSQQGLQFKKEKPGTKDDWLQEYVASRGWVFTERGVLAKEEAERLGLKPIK